MVSGSIRRWRAVSQDERRLILVCGHYEGLDERVREQAITREVSVGDYVLTGGELPALTILDATARLAARCFGQRNVGDR